MILNINTHNAFYPLNSLSYPLSFTASHRTQTNKLLIQTHTRTHAHMHTQLTIAFAHLLYLVFSLLSSSDTQTNKLLGEAWFHGFVSRREATLLLSNQPAGTFMIRFSKSQAGSFAVSFVSENHQVIRYVGCLR